MGDDDILEAAALWHVRQDGDAMDWPAFEAWLAVDARCRDAFDDIALLAAHLVDRLALPATEPTRVPVGGDAAA